MSFLEFFKNNLEEVSTPVEEVAPVEEHQEETPEEVVPEVDTPTETVETVVTEEPPTPKAPSLQEWLSEHNETVFNYLKAVNTDYKTLGTDQLVKMKLQDEHPEWSQEDIDNEIREVYFIGQSKKEIDTDEMTDDEIAQAEAHNRDYDRAQRLLKSKAQEAITYFDEKKSKIEFPDLDIPVQSAVDSQTEDFEQEIEKTRKAWTGLVETGVKTVDTIQKTISFVDNGSPVEITVDYKLSENQKQALQTYLNDYVAHPEDQKTYVQEDGSVVINQFVSDKAEKMFFENILKSALVEYGAKVRKEIIKDRVNFQEEPNPQSAAGGHISDDDRIQALWASRKSNV